MFRLLALLAVAGIVAVNTSNKKDKKKALLDYCSKTWNNGGKGLSEVINKMNKQEISDTYDLIFVYMKDEKKKKEISYDLRQRLEAISRKYSIFT